MRNRIIRLIRVICLIVLAVCLIRIGQAHLLSVRHEAQQKEWKAVRDGAADEASEQGKDAGGEKASADDDGVEKGGGIQTRHETQSGNELPQSGEETAEADKEKRAVCESGIPGEEGGHPILQKYKALYLENPDLVGWLTVEGTKIDYPVMQCEDDEYYLHHDFDGKDSKYGCLYVRERADLEEGTNFVIYGHNMRDGSMFGELDLYLEEEFYRGHSTVMFSTLFEEREYKILAVFRSRVYNDDADVFKYYQFYEAKTEEEFLDFYENIKALSLYETGVEAAFGDTFLTLSTCAYHVNDGRLAVVAKRME